MTRFSWLLLAGCLGWPLVVGCAASATVRVAPPVVPVVAATPAAGAPVTPTGPRTVDGTESKVVREHDLIHLRLKQAREFRSQGMVIDAALALKHAIKRARAILAFVASEKSRGTWVPGLLYQASTGVRQELQILTELADLERVAGLEYAQVEQEYTAALRKRYGVVGVSMYRLYETRGLYAGRDLTGVEVCWKYGINRGGALYTEYHCFDRNGNPLRSFARPGQHY